MTARRRSAAAATRGGSRPARWTSMWPFAVERATCCCALDRVRSVRWKTTDAQQSKAPMKQHREREEEGHAYLC
ncbi:hypothetical protein EJB05_53115, partial [Eragrostis curvula]